METDKTIDLKLFENEKEMRPGAKQWNLVEIAQLTSELRENQIITDSQNDELIKLIQIGDKRIVALSTMNLCKEQLKEAIVGIADSILENKPVSPLITAIQVTLSEKKYPSRMALKTIRRIVEKINSQTEKTPIITSKNFSHKKYIFNEPSAVALLEKIGFISGSEENGKTESLTLPAENAAEIESQMNGVLNSIDTALSRAANKGLSPNKAAPAKSSAGGGGTRSGDLHKNIIYCAKNCGFFGSQETLGLCSNCFKDQKKPKSPARSLEAPSKILRRAFKRADLLQWWRSLVQSEQTDITRCWKCNRKIGLFGIRCECRYYFCPKHRSTLDHKCGVDYKKKFEQKLLAENPMVGVRKVDGH